MLNEPNPSFTKQAAVIRHLAFEDLGTFADILTSYGFHITYYEAGVDDVTAIGRNNPDLMIVLGGPISAYADDTYPYLLDTIKVMKQRIKSNAPILGICLGAQLLARALDAKVFPGAAKEIGWSVLDLTSEGRRSPLKHLKGVPVLHWHGDVIETGQFATLLASTPLCRNQAFTRGKRHLGLQFHLEVDPNTFERWLIGHSHEIEATPGLEVASLREATRVYANNLKAAGARVLGQWLKGLPGVTAPTVTPVQIERAKELLLGCLMAEAHDFARSELSAATYAYSHCDELQTIFTDAAHLERTIIRPLSGVAANKLRDIVTKAHSARNAFYAEATSNFVQFFRNEMNEFEIDDIPRTPASFIYRRHPELREHFSSSGNYARLMTERMTHEQRDELDILHQQVLDRFVDYGVRQKYKNIVTRGEFISTYQHHVDSGLSPSESLGMAFGEWGIVPDRSHPLLAALGPKYHKIFRSGRGTAIRRAQTIIRAKTDRHDDPTRENFLTGSSTQELNLV